MKNTEQNSREGGNIPSLFPLFNIRKNSRKTLIGVPCPGYGHERVSYALPVERFAFKKSIIVPFKRIFNVGTFTNYTPIVVDPASSLIHTWNAIPLCPQPFVISFENELPRYLNWQTDAKFRFGRSILESDRCRAILALTETAAEQRRQEFVALGLLNAARKIHVFKGGIPLNPGSIAHQRENLTSRQSDRCIRLLFVGGDMARKGFFPMLEAVKQLVREGYHLSLTVVGNSCKRGLFLNESQDALDRSKQFLDSTPWIEWHQTVSQGRISELMRSHDLFLFPTYDESLGWVPLEASLERTPVITTNAYAIPEMFEQDVTGHVIQLPLTSQKRWKGLFLRGKEHEQCLRHTSDMIKQGIYQGISSYCENPNRFEKMAQTAYEKVSQTYCPGQAARTIEQIYTQALEGPIYTNLADRYTLVPSL